MVYRKNSVLFVLLAVTLGLTGCTEGDATTSSDDNVVNIYNWADYIGEDTIALFEAEYGIKVNYDIYDGSQVVDVKLLAGNSGYDVVVHSSQYSSRLAPIRVYEPLDYSKLDNMRHLDTDMIAKTDVYVKTRGYTTPYFWGTTGYAWNEDLVRARLPDHPMDSADVLFDPAVASKLADCGISLLDGPTDIYPMVLAFLGRDPNAVDDESLAAAEAQLMMVRPYIRYFSNQKMQVDLPNQEVCVAMSWSGDYAQAAITAKQAGLDIKLHYTMPKEGSGLWVDAVYMPADAPHKENGYLFMNFLMRPKIAAGIANAVHYANANRASWEFIDPSIMNDPAIYPAEEDWSVLYPILAVDPKRERFRTRSYTRVKSGL